MQRFKEKVILELKKDQPHGVPVHFSRNEEAMLAALDRVIDRVHREAEAARNDIKELAAWVKKTHEKNAIKEISFATKSKEFDPEGG